MEPYKSVYDNQTDILKAINALHLNGEWFECDATYGNGVFYKEIPQPKYKYDIDPQLPEVTQACSTMLPLPDASINSFIFDPPFLTYVRQNREGNGNMIMAKRFAGYWRYDELEDHYINTISEAYRVLVKSGKFIIKCQDIIHNHKMHCTHQKVINWAESEGFTFCDLFILPAKHRLPSPNRAGKQKHARIFHSYFLVFEK